MKSLIVILLFICFIAKSQPSVEEDPGINPADSSLVKRDIFGFPLSSFLPELVCDSVQIAEQRGKKFLILYYRGKRLVVYRKENKLKKGQTEFY